MIISVNSDGADGSEDGGGAKGKSRLESLTEEGKLGNVTAVVGKVSILITDN